MEFVPPNCSKVLSKALEAMFDDMCETVTWFCFELDFGRKYGEDMGYSNFVDGVEWPLRNVDELYDYLIYMKNSTGNK